MALGCQHYSILHCAIFLILIQDGCAIDFKNFFSATVEKVQDFACKHLICCEFHLNPKESWLHGDRRLLELLDERLHGQHIAKSLIFEAVSKHMIKPSVKVSRSISPKPLRILMYGPTGTGKNYASQLIAEAIYKKGLKSPLVHMFAGKSTFPVQNDDQNFLSMLKHWIYGNASDCQYSMFIFDEFDHWLESVVKTTNLVSSLGILRNAIFIYIINSGSSETVDSMLELYESGMIREDIQLYHIHKSPHGSAACKSLACLSQQTGRRNTLFYNAYLAVTNLLTYFTENEENDHDIEIDYIIPFLPLEEKHVRSCVVDHFMDKGRIYPSKEMIEWVQNQKFPMKSRGIWKCSPSSVLIDVKFGPGEREVFSTLGCRRIHSLVINALATQYPMGNHDEL